MKLEDFNYRLPKNLIAQTPMRPRDQSRLLVCIKRRTTNAAHANLNKEECKIEHKHFYDIVNYLHKGDVLVLNNSKVFPVRLIGRKIPTGGKIEVFLLRKNLTLASLCGRSGPTLSFPEALFGASVRRGRKGEVWQCLVGNHGRREDLIVEFSRGLKAKILKHNSDGTWLVGFNKRGKILMDIVKKIGQTPLPPYIKRKGGRRQVAACLRRQDSRNYQTVYASDKKVRSVAAPTAGFHFTKNLLKKLKAEGVQIEYITLHIGLGTFAPVKVDDITKHQMHEEYVEVSADTIKRIIEAKSEGRRIIAVGTTSVRTLESIFTQMPNAKSKIQNQKSKNKILNLTAQAGLKSKITNYNSWINLFIYPGYKFKVVDAMITNFHLPKSTLLMLVCAFAVTSTTLSAGRNNILKVYKSAIRKKYRFYSYGDAMFIY